MPEVERRRKRPLPVEMLLWDGTNFRQFDDFTGNDANVSREGGELRVWNDQEKAWMGVPLGHRVVKSTLGEMYPMSPEAYEKTTEPVDGAAPVVATFRKRDVDILVAACAAHLPDGVSPEVAEAFDRLLTAWDDLGGWTDHLPARCEVWPCDHALLLERAGKALAVLGAMKAEWLCEPCKTIRPWEKGDFISVPCPDCGAFMMPTSPLLRDYHRAEALIADAREVLTNFLGQYGTGEIPMFKVGQDLANSVLKRLNGVGLGADADLGNKEGEPS